MANKIIIGDGKRKEKRPSIHEVPVKTERKAVTEAVRETTPETAPVPLDENVWGNDNTILRHLDEKVIADRRLFVRIRHMQRVECTLVADSPDAEPYSLATPLVFMISDLSMGGIGIISENKIDVGKILVIRLVLDGIAYDVKCEVIYCFPNDDKFRAGLKIIRKEKQFIQHLKIYIARISLNSAYGEDKETSSRSL